MVARNTGSLDEIAARADGSRRELEELIDADATAFDEVMAAFRLPKETEEQKAERSAAIQAGYKAAVEPPTAVCERALSVLSSPRRSRSAGTRTRSSCRSDDTRDSGSGSRSAFLRENVTVERERTAA